MAVISSRIKEGVLTFGTTTPVDFSCQPTNIRLTPTTNTEDPVETLCGDTVAGTGSTSWALNGTAIQDFDDVDGFLLYAFQNNGDTVDFSWTPNAGAGEWTGQCVIQALEIGGDINARVTTDFSFPVVGTPIHTPPVGGTTGGTTTTEPSGSSPAYDGE